MRLLGNMALRIDWFQQSVRQTEPVRRSSHPQGRSVPKHWSNFLPRLPAGSHMAGARDHGGGASALSGLIWKF